MSKKVLVVEDDSVLQEAIKTALENEGFGVIQMFSGKKCIEIVKKEKPDLILMDLLVPEVDGYHLMHEMCEKLITKKIPIIVLTVVDSKTSGEECKTYGIKDYLVKSDYTIQDVVKKVKKFIV